MPEATGATHSIAAVDQIWHGHSWAFHIYGHNNL